MKSSISIMIIACSLSLAADFGETIVYKQGDNGFNTYRIPSLYYTKNGVVLAFAEARKNSTSDTGDIDIVLRRSLDQGKTWLPIQTVWDDGENTCGNPTVVQDENNGRIWLFLTHNLGCDSQKQIAAGTSKGVRTIWSCYSDNDGEDWSKPVNRFKELQSPKTRWDATGPGRGIQLKQGSKAGRLIIPAIGRNLQTDDGGATWQQSGKLPGGSSEASIAEIAGGAILRNDRAVANKELNARALCTSYDQGQKWSELDFRKELKCPICQGSMIAVKHPAGIEERMLVFANPSAQTRVNMTIQCSFDDGKTWPVKKTVFPGASAYCCLSNLDEGFIGLLYENGDSPSKAASLYKKITFAKISVASLCKGYDIKPIVNTKTNDNNQSSR